MESLRSDRSDARTHAYADGVRTVIVCCLVVLLGLGLGVSTGCTSDEAGGEAEAAGEGMGGPAVEVQVTEEALASEPETIDLSTPEAAVRSYLDWSSYAYRIAQPRVALPTMTSYQEVRVDAYIQYNIQKGRLIDQTLESLEVQDVREGEESVEVVVKETWSYNYVSVKNAGEVISGPHEASYDAIYTVVQQGDDWVVDAVEATALGPVE
ncbi:hypothetical protein [Anaerosoma tenue]|uniref:hypothetical protein n=1 Tax=Anaerosoma tenue TaxID=2933588 RepID=UPI0022610045|nr:hypothetical protein [Anaerosoma tenue]MCK8114948.1 hypothetical protein [Anaerosoma tenue]